jgi:hypothetical protein
MPAPLNANKLRWLGEHADGLRGETLALIWEDNEMLFVPLSDPRSARAMFQVRTNFGGEGGLQSTGKVGLTYAGQPIQLKDADAAFWTQSSVEKFVLPYYMRVWSPRRIADLRTELFAADVVVALHSPPSITRGVLQPRIKVCRRHGDAGPVEVSGDLDLADDQLDLADEQAGA